MDLSYFIEDFNDNGDEYIKWFGDLETFFDFLDKKGALDQLGIDIETNDDIVPIILAWYVKKGKLNEIKDTVVSQLGDIRKVGDKYLLVLDNMSELSVLFGDSNRNGSKDFVERVLDTEDYYEPFWDTTDDVYRDVIKELNEKNLNSLKMKIIKDLSGKKLSPETDEMELIANEQGHDDFWVVNSENINRVLEDEDTMKSLLGDELADLKSEFHSLHNAAYNSAYENQVFKEVWKDLSEYVQEGEWVGVPNKYKSGQTKYEYIIDVSSNIDEILKDFILENERLDYTSTPYYHGSYLSLLTNLQENASGYEKLRYYPPDYVDFRELEKNINDMFSDYIY